LENLAGTDDAARMISMRLLMPAPKDQLTKALEGAKRVIVVEQTHSGQFMGYLRANIDLPRDAEHYCIPGPLPMRPGDIVSLVKEGTPS
jgi:2-oxoglutarate/2-oxoacid ferredoxin oxidoreductase subunit alpha